MRFRRILQKLDNHTTIIFAGTGIVDDVGFFKDILESHKHSTHYLISDTKVYGIYGNRIVNVLQSAGMSIVKLIIKEGENSKSARVYLKLVNKILKNGVDKNSIIFSLGGGVVNNISGFIASTIYRGIGLIHIPTTFMAQADVTIDFKQAINFRYGKNLIGSFYNAKYVIIDSFFLLTLDDRNISNGISESIKHALTQNMDFFNSLVNLKNSFRENSFIERSLMRTVELKIELLENKSTDSYSEMAMQYGHCIGHAIEKVSKYSLLHGEALAVGMCVSSEIAKVLGLCQRNTVEAHYEICGKFKLPTTIPGSFDINKILSIISYDKNFLNKKPHFGFVNRVGTLFQSAGNFSIPVNISAIKEGINNNIKRMVIK
jgi:3-dehydroquinate synthase